MPRTTGKTDASTGPGASGSTQQWVIVPGAVLPAAVSGLVAQEVPGQPGVVLLAGGQELQADGTLLLSTALWLFDGNTTTDHIGDTLRLPEPRAFLTAAPLANGSVLVFGGAGQAAGGAVAETQDSFIINVVAATLSYGSAAPWLLMGAAVAELPAVPIGGGTSTANVCVAGGARVSSSSSSSSSSLAAAAAAVMAGAQGTDRTTVIGDVTNGVPSANITQIEFVLLAY